MRDIIIEGAPQTSTYDRSLHDQSAPTTLTDGDQRYAVEYEYLVGWQGPGPEKARLIREIQARDRKMKEALARRQSVRFPGR
jgi:hypothetical protein